MQFALHLPRSGCLSRQARSSSGILPFSKSNCLLEGTLSFSRVFFKRFCMNGQKSAQTVISFLKNFGKSGPLLCILPQIWPKAIGAAGTPVQRVA
ncbi:MAG: hypothetical protein LUC35_09250 [Clostridiales bacterium]|nr:hypothetical protein [Clostridiales bacterium]